MPLSHAPTDLAPTCEEAIAQAEALVAAGRPDDADHLVDVVEVDLGPGAADDLLRARMAYVRAQCHLLWGDLDAALVLHVMRLRGTAATAGDERATAIALIDVMGQLGRFDEARRRYAGRTLGAADQTDVAMAEAWSSLALQEGRLGKAVALAGVALAAAHGDPEGPATVRSHWVLGTAMLERGEVHQAVASLTVAERAARAAGLQHVCVRTAAALARARAQQGEPGHALALIDHARRPCHAHRLSPRLRRWLDQAEARLLLDADEPESAAALVDQMRPDADPETTLLRAWCALRRGDREAAADELRSTLSPEASEGQRVEADVLRAATADDDGEARAALLRALHRAEHERYVTVFLEHRAEIGPALRRLAGAQPTPYLVDLVQRLDR